MDAVRRLNAVRAALAARDAEYKTVVNMRNKARKGSLAYRALEALRCELILDVGAYQARERRLKAELERRGMIGTEINHEAG